MTQPNNEAAEVAALIKIFKQDIAKFADLVFGSKLRPKQIEFANAVRDNRQVAFKGGVGFGKTHILAILTWWSITCFNDVGVTIFAPNEGQIKSGVWKEISSLYAKMHPLFKAAFDLTATKATRHDNPTGVYAEYKLASKDNVDGARGIHNLNNFVFVDEATGVADEIYTGALINVLTDKNPKLVLISNPSRSDGFFWRVFNDTSISNEWVHITGKASDNPDLTFQEQQRMEKQYGGKDSRQYRIMMEGEFPLESSDSLISRTLVDKAVANTEVEKNYHEAFVWGFDPAGAGENADRSVLAIRNDRYLVELRTFRGLDAVQLAYKLRDEYQATPDKEKPTVIAVDAIGYGDSFTSVLKEFGLPIKFVKTNERPTRHPEKYHKLRDQLFWETKEWFATEDVRIPNDPSLIEELLMATYQTDTGKIKIEAKKDMKKRLGGKSPDFVDALNLTMAVSATRYVSKYGWKKPIVYTNLARYE